MAAVETLIADARSFAAQVAKDGQSALSQMQQNISNIGFTNLVFTGVTLPTAPVVPDAITAPTLAAVTLTLPTEPSTALVLQDISDIDAGVAPTLGAIAPTITMPTEPSSIQDFTEAAPVINTSYAFPDLPAQLVNPVFVEPTLGTYTSPAAPTVALPSFDTVAPVNDTVAPTDLATQLVASYRDVAPQFVAALDGQMDAMLTRYNPQYANQIAAIEAQITAYQAGGTGLAPNVENAIYARSTAKQEAEARRASDAAFDTMAGRGFPMPAGAVASSIRDSRQAASDANAEIGRAHV